MTNYADRTIWTGDNLGILRGLIYLDPPFNSKPDYAGQEAETTSKTSN